VVPRNGDEPARAVRFRYLRFLLVGLLNTGFGYSLYAVLLVLGLSLEWSLLLATVIGVIFNFFTNARLVFGDGRASRFPRFVVAYLVVWLIMAPVVRAVAERHPWVTLVAHLPILGRFESLAAPRLLDELLAGLLALPLSVTLTYVLLSRLVFRTGAKSA
jgi:putative flippase GtrA